ncbi:hypothetical protein AVEN_48457-1 [Araneus ventricosus]|uniref:Uncharacterized protein n=1 Tax=Araneus ventricosus TaxID=182803 RepID=A0A4Y2Q7W3_ARAVE|nr:hypothetical protein AVEN_48457-1 [Araneus ventricosus]
MDVIIPPLPSIYRIIRVLCHRLQGQTASKRDSIEEPPCDRVWSTLNPSGPNVLPLGWCRSLERGYQLRSRHLTTVQNSEVRSKIALVLLQNEA